MTFHLRNIRHHVQFLKCNSRTQNEQRVKQRVVQGLTEDACCDAADDITVAAVASMCTDLARELYFNSRWAGDVAASIMISSSLASSGRPLPPSNQPLTYSEAVEAASNAADILRAISQIARRNRGRLTLHTMSMPSRSRVTRQPLPYHVHTPPPAIPVLNLYALAHSLRLRSVTLAPHVRSLAPARSCTRHGSP